MTIILTDPSPEDKKIWDLKRDKKELQEVIKEGDGLSNQDITILQEEIEELDEMIAQLEEEKLEKEAKTPAGKAKDTKDWESGLDIDISKYYAEGGRTPDTRLFRVYISGLSDIRKANDTFVYNPYYNQFGWHR